MKFYTKFDAPYNFFHDSGFMLAAKLLVGNANLFAYARYMKEASTNPDFTNTQRQCR
ncbi:hypothetical protein [Poriferisphaera corsica]|uniref:hypothetical protein n=1 Tax=Poriferisphaera corsica TaxID=2528020 RepID=UPI00190C4033|nr:hypothetical protein [Poriferisphaera corsica]